jgi:hypothetical protein
LIQIDAGFNISVSGFALEILNEFDSYLKRKITTEAQRTQSFHYIEISTLFLCVSVVKNVLLGGGVFTAFPYQVDCTKIR